MDKNQFHQGINKLNTCFKDFYNPQRTEIIWKEFSSIQPETWNYLVDDLIRKCRIAPTIEEMCDLAASFRERDYNKQKQDFKNDAISFWKSSYSDEDKKWIMDTIKRRITGGVSDEEYTAFLEVLDKVATESEKEFRRCPKCDDSGLIHKSDEQKYQFVFRCTCKHGQSREDRKIPTWSESMREIYG